MHMFCRLSVYIVQIMFLNELYYNKFYHLLVYFLTCCLCSNFNNFISCFKGFSGSIFLSTPKAAVRSAVYMLSAIRMLLIIVAVVVAFVLYICILYSTASSYKINPVPFEKLFYSIMICVCVYVCSLFIRFLYLIHKYTT